MFANIQHRIHSIDILRGLVMVIMALDHTRELLHIDFPKEDPLNFQTTTPILFMTRWITHFCAPIFVFLSGASAYLSILKENNIAQSRKFLLKRGLWLILLEFTLIGFGIIFDTHFNFILFQVIGAIGFGFVILALLLSFNAKVITAIGMTILLFHNLIDLAPENIRALGAGLFSNTAIPLGGQRVFVIGYPPIPWLGIMMIGYGSGILFLKDILVRRKIFIQLGIIFLVSFLVLRFINVYGNATLWEVKQTPIFTVLSFVDLTKYPPSLLFTLFFIGWMFLLLAYFDQYPQTKIANFLKVYGSVPLFFYILHWYLLQAIKFSVLFIQGFTYQEIVSGDFGRPNTPNGFELGGVYLTWIAVILILYPICKKYSQYKKENKSKTWLKYL